MSSCRIFSLTVTILFSPAITFSDIIITEIMYNPAGNENYTEFVEIYNSSPGGVFIPGWQISDGTATDEIISTAGNESDMLQPGHYALILDSGYWENGDSCYAEVIPEGTLLFTTADAAIGSRGLSNSTRERVSLINTNGDTVSSRMYQLGADQGHSEERIFLYEGENDQNWTFSLPGGSPGSTNTVTPPLLDMTVDSLNISFDQSSENGFNNLLVEAYIRNRGSETSPDTPFILNLFKTADNEIHSELDWNIPSINYNDQYYLVDSMFIEISGQILGEGYLDIQDDDLTNNIAYDLEYASYSYGALRINELMPQPPADLPYEWIELVNHFDESISPENWFIEDAGGSIVNIDSTAISLEVKGYLLLSENGSISSWEGIPLETIYLPGSWLSLNNEGDRLGLYDPTGKLIDQVVYSDTESGLSLNRMTCTDSCSVDDWVSSRYPQRGTPGSPNNAESNEPGGESPKIRVSPNPFSPDGDGFEDLVDFEFVYPANEVDLSLQIFDVNGRRMVTPLDGKRFPGRGHWQWNGQNGTGKTLPVGLYVFLLEARETAGSGHWDYKGTIAIAGSER